MSTNLTECFITDLIRATSHAIRHVLSGSHSPHKAHERVRGFYSWEDVAERTERVYADVMASAPYDFWTRVSRYALRGPEHTLVLMALLPET